MFFIIIIIVFLLIFCSSFLQLQAADFLILLEALEKQHAGAIWGLTSILVRILSHLDGSGAGWGLWFFVAFFSCTLTTHFASFLF